ncbi:tubulin polyglutamylase TTLL5-like isoform X3 [Dreissena polymorpha]|uniref:tubulin polyglutamylase TTLL5-like isoform X3 n=1 Tax=Dreissena polymorpha TaxID=45954 RepID=UPI0022651DA7|nr:tubulin polyglutamylase TTLL5-like isoform X3 [Dreissena polymorpha]
MASTKEADSDGSFTPSEGSDLEVHSDHDSDYESEEEEDPKSKSNLNIQWTGYGKKTPVIVFNPESVFNKRLNMRIVGERYHMTYKFGNSECKIVRTILNAHGFHEVHPNSSDYNIVWTGAHLKPFTLRSLSEFQKINHFPRSYELTRKDRLFKNLQRMQQIKGLKHFDIVPATYVLPGEYQDFCSAFLKDKGPWIVKPVASSRGRGIFLVNHPDQIPLDENLVVCRYINNPLLIDGFKFDIRLYVAVTSYDPLQIYLYEEGLTRFASVKYEKNMRHMRNTFMHLTNYSINKKNEEYVSNDDADVEDYGNKWSMGAMLRYLRSNGQDTAALMMKIEDVIIKTIISVELPIATACKMFMPFKGNCFELYGFDIMIDENLKPWVLEVNLSPSLACDSPLDLKIKGHMLCDLFSLTGIICHDPMMRTLQQSRRNQDVASKMAARAKSARVRTMPISVKQRPSSAGSLKKGSTSNRESEASTNKNLAGLNSEEIRILRRIKEEDSRKGGWVRIFPTADSWDLYSSFLQFTTTHNVTLHQKLYPDRHKSSSTAVVARGSTSVGSRTKGDQHPKLTLSAYIQLTNNTSSVKPTAELSAAYAHAMMRTRRYERKLGTRRFKTRRRKRTERRERPKLVQGVQEESGEEQGGEEQEEVEDDEQPITERNISEKNNQMSKKMENPPSRTESEEVIQIVVDKERGDGAGPKKATGLASLARNKEPEFGATLRATLGATEEEGQGPGAEAMMNVPSAVGAQLQVHPPEPKYNVVELLTQGFTLSKVQARTAFAMYLVRVQQRLMADSNSLTQDDVDGLNEQMDLVLRFLKRAAVNLQQPFKVVVPSRKLPLNDRRRILAKQLGDFVHIYNKHCMAGILDKLETEQLHARQQQERKHSHARRANGSELDDTKFDRFVHTASEGELEEVLTTYTKINKSASIFLGGKSPAEANNHIPTTGTTKLGNSMQHIGATSSAMRTESQASLGKRRESSMSDKTSTPVPPKTVTGWEDVPKAIHSVPTSSSDLRPQPTGTLSHTGSQSSLHQASRPASYNTNSASSYATAVQVYTQKLSTLRPHSAKSTGPKTEKLRSRPSSAHMSRPTSAAHTAYGSTPDLQGIRDPDENSSSPKRSSIQFSKHFARKDPYNERVITEALQRLTMRQQARQYSAINSTSLVPSDTSRPSSAAGVRLDGENKRPWTAYETTGVTHTASQVSRDQGAAGDSGIVTSSKYISMEEHVSKNRPPSGTREMRVQSAIDLKTLESQRKKQTNVNLQSANATFNSFIDDHGQQWQNDLAMAYSQVTGVVPQNYHTPSQSSKQYQILQQQTQLKQQSKVLLEQSKAKHQVWESKVLLEQSKAKHQAMIAQAHAVQKSLTRPESENTMVQMYAPKPPIKPGSRKATSSHHRMPRRTVPEETSLNFQFYSSNKPAMNGGW